MPPRKVSTHPPPSALKTRTMWGFLRVENEHLRIYDPGTGDLGGAAPGSHVGIEGREREEKEKEARLRNSLDGLPFSRMEISGGRGAGQSNPIKTWCLTKVRAESRRRLLVELVVFSLVLGMVIAMAALDKPDPCAGEGGGASPGCQSEGKTCCWWC
ncbi:unnamed protein product [Discosporangium mesarthrocarpum]